MEIMQKITEALEALFAEGSLSDCFLLEILPHGKNGITVFIDSDTGVTLEKCTRVSRYLEKMLDEQGFLGTDYILDVSSPGIERPLRQWRQYPRQKGRTLVIKLKDGAQVEGKLEEVAMETISVQTALETSVEIPFTDIDESFVQISF
jgi:ribosome maturation factor RimP